MLSTLSSIVITSFYGFLSLWFSPTRINATLYCCRYCFLFCFVFIHNYISYFNRFGFVVISVFSVSGSSSALTFLQQSMTVGVLKHYCHNPVHVSQHITALRTVLYLTATQALLFRVCEFSSVLSSHLTFKNKSHPPPRCLYQ